MKRILEKYAGMDTLVELYARPDDASRFDVGWVLGVDEKYVLLQGLDDKGRKDGLLLRLLENVICVQAETLYLKRIERLSARYIPDKSGMPMPRGGMLGWLIRYAVDGRLGISVEIANSGSMDICGRVDHDSAQLLSVRQLDADGMDDGLAYVPHDQITRMDCDSADERCRLFLAGK